MVEKDLTPCALMVHDLKGPLCVPGSRGPWCLAPPTHVTCTPLQENILEFIFQKPRFSKIASSYFYDLLKNSSRLKIVYDAGAENGSSVNVDSF